MVRALGLPVNPAEEFDWAGRLRERIDRVGITRTELARQSFVSRSHLIHLLRGTRVGTPEVHASVAKALGVDDPGLLFPRSEAELVRARAFRSWAVDS